jgi:hypothetical protein
VGRIAASLDLLPGERVAIDCAPGDGFVARSSGSFGSAPSSLAAASKADATTLADART